MILSRQAYDDLRTQLMEAQAEVKALTQVNAQLNAHVEWMRVRLTQVEFERAGLIKRYMNIDVPVPMTAPDDSTPDPNQVMDFADIGDKAAAALGINWNPDGTVNYGRN